MEELKIVQTYLKDTKRYPGEIDGLWGPLTRNAILRAFSDGTQDYLSDLDFINSAYRLSVPVAHIKAIAEVEAAGSGFSNGYIKILTEPHIFSGLTKHKFDKTNPSISYPRWGMRPYPKTQHQRYNILLDMIKISPMAGFSSASYGKFQILGLNFKICGYKTSMEFAIEMAKDEKTQLIAFENFLRSNNILPDLRVGNWKNVARKYNGPGYRKNRYDEKLRAAAKRYS